MGLEGDRHGRELGRGGRQAVGLAGQGAKLMVLAVLMSHISLTERSICC